MRHLTINPYNVTWELLVICNLQHAGTYKVFCICTSTYSKADTIWLAPRGALGTATAMTMKRYLAFSLILVHSSTVHFDVFRSLLGRVEWVLIWAYNLINALDIYRFHWDRYGSQKHSSESWYISLRSKVSIANMKPERHLLFRSLP